MQCKNNRRIIIIAVICFLASSLFIIRNHYKSTIEIFYQADTSNRLNGRMVEIYWNNGLGYSSDEVSVAKIFKRSATIDAIESYEDLQSVRIDFLNDSIEFKIKKIVFRSGLFTSRIISAQEIYDNASFANVINVEVKDNVLYVEPLNDDAQCHFNDWFIKVYKHSMDVFSDLTKYFLLGINLIMWLVITFFSLKKNIYLVFREHKFYYIGCISVIVALVLVSLMAGLSETYGHPDEDVTAAAIDYYVKYWGLPNFSEQEALDSFSNYGSTRLGEQSIYYFLAGKIGWILKNIFRINAYYRGLNVLLFCILCGLYFKYGKKCPWMIFGILFSPQLIYIFSYATSDAWDYFLSYIAIFMILYKDSIFNKALQHEKLLGKFGGLITEGIIFGLLFLGKKNYYIVFLLAFVILLIRWLKRRKTMLMAKYMLALLMFLLIIISRMSLDTVVYNGNKSKVLSEISNNVVGEEEKASISETIKLKDSGVPLYELLSEKDFLEISFKSFCGYYGWMRYESGFFYYMFVFTIYIGLVVVHYREAIKFKYVRGYIQLLIGWILGAVLVFLSLINSWIYDFQPQGRYILPAIIVVMWISSLIKSKDLREKQMQHVFLLSALSFYSFIYYGLFNLI